MIWNEILKTCIDNRNHLDPTFKAKIADRFSQLSADDPEQFLVELRNWFIIEKKIGLQKLIETILLKFWFGKGKLLPPESRNKYLTEIIHHKEDIKNVISSKSKCHRRKNRSDQFTLD